MMRIAVDAMGGDDAPSTVVEGAIHAAQQAEGDLHVALFGPEEQIQQELARHDGADALPIAVVDAPEVIGMGEAPATAVKRKQNSSIHRGLQAHAQDQADAFVSAGNTGAIMGASLFILGRISGVERPTIIGFFPTTEGSCIVTDIGSNVDCKPQNLLQFAQMGTIYARQVFGLDSPSVALLNVGEEPGKGNEQVKSTFDLMQDAADLNFIGNIEGGDILRHAADVVVCDGFIGNIVLKFGESLMPIVSDMVQAEMKRQQLTPDQQKAVGGILGSVRKGFESEERGGAPLMGVKGNVLVGHGRSNVRAIKQMILSAADMAEKDVVHPMQDAFAS